jgi:hypothetical protein
MPKGGRPGHSGRGARTALSAGYVSLAGDVDEPDRALRVPPVVGRIHRGADHDPLQLPPHEAFPLGDAIGEWVLVLSMAMNDLACLIELNPEYCELARNRIVDDAPLLNGVW